MKQDAKDNLIGGSDKSADGNSHLTQGQRDPSGQNCCLHGAEDSAGDLILPNVQFSCQAALGQTVCDERLKFQHQIDRLTRELEETQSEIIFKLAEIVETRSRETGSHVIRVAELSSILALKAGLPEEQAEILRLAAPMHDVGKVGIPDVILHNPGRLTDEEFEVMKTHTIAGYEMLKGSRRKILQAAAIIALQHHEKFNGMGYPLGLSGERINIFGRITCIADVFDALNSDRVYRRAWDFDQVIDFFRKERGESFDPLLVDVLLENIDEFMAVRERLPADKMSHHNAIVTNWTSRNPSKPTAIHTSSASPHTNASLPENMGYRPKPAKVLIVEDDPNVRETMHRTLGECGYQTLEAENGLDAWKILKRQDSPRLVLVNLHSDGLDGVDLCHKIRSLHGQDYTYVLLMADPDKQDEIIEATEAGADGWVSLPLKPDELRASLRAAQRILDLQSELIAARESLREQATRDALTTLWNRPAILDILRLELNRASREKTSVGVILADLDFFKRINDTHGHRAGDTVLQEAAERMRAAVRPYDGFARYGGEEFLVVLPRCDSTFARYVAERLRRCIHSKPIEVDGKQLNVTISVGVTAKCNVQDTDADMLIQAADEALYHAKASGRNCVMVTELATESDDTNTI